MSEISALTMSPGATEAGLQGSAASETLRGFCLGLPGVIEDSRPNQLCFRVGPRAFAVIETFHDTDGEPFSCIAFKASFLDYERLSSTRGYYPAPYLGGAGWLGRRLDARDAAETDRLVAVLSRSHRQIAGRTHLRNRPMLPGQPLPREG